MPEFVDAPVWRDAGPAALAIMEFSKAPRRASQTDHDAICETDHLCLPRTIFRAQGFTSGAWFRKMNVSGFDCAVAVCEKPPVVSVRGIVVAFLGTNHQPQASNHGDVRVP